jgi:biopolymer transport protein ExbB/TolQ
MVFLVILWTILLGTALLAYLIYPIFGKVAIFHEVDATEARMQTLSLEREQSYSALADLDEDYETGKLSEKDYKELRAALLQETANIVSQLEAAAKTDVEAEIERYKQQKSGS